ncbi:hypothetical protein VTO73DRAFT_9861 [Trametes versicolor]
MLARPPDRVQTGRSGPGVRRSPRESPPYPAAPERGGSIVLDPSSIAHQITPAGNRALMRAPVRTWRSQKPHEAMGA